VCLPQCVHDQLEDIWWIVNSLNARPTCWAEIVDSSPAFIGTVDASCLGMGGTWISCIHAAPLLWRHRFDATISNRLVWKTQPARSPTQIWSSSHSRATQIYLQTTTTFMKKPSAPYRTIRQQSPVNAEDPLPPICHLHISAVSPPSTNTLDATTYGSTTSRAHSMS
jgi:hypothetical protein